MTDDTLRISRDLTLLLTGEVRGVACGRRPSGMAVGRQDGLLTLHLVPPAAMAYAPAVHAAVAGSGVCGVACMSDGRVRLDKMVADPAAVVDAIEAVCASGDRAGFAPGEHGVYSVAHATTGWHYAVTTPASGRSSVKRIGTWTGVEGEFMVGFDASAALGAVLDKAVGAKAKGETTVIKLPQVPGVQAWIEGGEILVRPQREDNDVVRAVRSMRWDAGRCAYAVSTRYAKSVAKALEEVRGRVEGRAARAVEKAEADKAAAAARRSEGERLGGILRERLAGSPVARVGADGHVQLSFRYDADLVAVARGLPGARFDGAAKRWNFLAATSSDVERIVAGAALIASGVAALAEADAEALRSRASEAQARFADNPYRIERCADAPAVGDTWRLGRDGVVVVTSHGKRFRGDDDLSSLGGPVWAEGEWCCQVYHRAATADEVAALEAREEAARARSRAAAEVRETVRRIDREGEPVDLGREPEGEVLLRNDRSAIVGYATRVVLDAEGGLWSVVYDGSDGGAWGMYNLGYNTRGRRLRVSPGEVAAFRDAVAAAGGMAG